VPGISGTFKALELRAGRLVVEAVICEPVSALNFVSAHPAEEAMPEAGSLALVVLPLSLSLDNLAAGVGLGALGFPAVASALLIGLVSGSMCALGLFAGERLGRWVPRPAELWSGVYLLALAAFRLVRDLA
jgi:putative Mn2+ efflux pump MntP